jgi:hypothetical protein
MLLGALPQVVEIIFEVQMKRSNENSKEKKSFAIHKTHYFLFFLLFGSFVL